MKIFLVIPTIKQGGAERVMSELANQWSKENQEVHLILLADAKQFYILNENVIVHSLGFKNLGLFSKIFSEIKVFFKLRKLFKTQKPDVILSFMDKYNVLSILSSRFLNLNVFISDRSNPRKKISKSLFILKKMTYKYATGIIAQTSLANEVLFRCFKHDNISTIPNPIKVVMLYPNLTREKIIINVGRMVPEKGQKYLIDAFAKIADSSWKLVILGDGPLKVDLERQIKRLGLEEKVILPGIVQHVDEFLARSSIFAFPSISEGFPNALIEAMSAGLPVVSFDCDAGPRDIITNRVDGILIEEKNISQLTAVIDELSSNFDLRNEIGTCARNVSDQLDIKIIAERYLEFFNNKSKCYENRY